jgi:hypothetical protein
MNDLIARLEAAEHGSRELDMAIAIALGWKEILAECWEAPDEERTLHSAHPTWTTCLTTIMALIAKKLPGFALTGTTDYRGSTYFHLKHGNISVVAFAKTEPLARCIAFLRAIEGTSHDT